MKRNYLFMALLLVASTALALDPNQKSGFVANQVYQVGEIDSVNTFNGNVTLQIPIGQPYKVGPELEYQLRLSYNSKIWDYKTIPFSPTGCNPTENPCNTLRYGTPDEKSNAGFGWTLSLGRLLQPRGNPQHGWVYVSPDGAMHAFDDIIDPSPIPIPFSDWDINQARTTDLSYLQLRRMSSPTGWWKVEFPNGHWQEFDDEGRLRYIRDRYNNWVKIVYTSTVWTITDGHGLYPNEQVARTHYVNIEDRSALYPLEESFQSVVSSVDLEVFDLDTSNDSNPRATYSFTYENRWVGRGGGGERRGGTPSYCIRAPFLENIELADGTTYDPEYSKLLPDPLPGEPEPAQCVVDDWSGPAFADSGVIESLKLPTGGSIEWVHGVYEMQLQACRPADGYEASYVGVRSRTFKTRTGEELMKWTYTPTLVSKGVDVNRTCDTIEGLIPSPSTEFYNDVEVWSGPSGSGGKKLRTRHYYSAYPDAEPSIPNLYDGAYYGLPFTYDRKIGSSSTSDLRYLSTESADCTSTCDTFQKRYVLYEADATAHRNKREVAQRTEETNDTGCGGVCYTDTQRSDWDLFGHYQTTVTTSNFPGSLKRTTYVDYTPNESTWLLGTYTDSWVRQHTSETTSTGSKTISTFDTNGALISKRVLRESSGNPAFYGLSSTDLLTAYCREGTAGARGFVTSERHFGGDHAPIPANPCGAARGSGHYFINHTYGFDGAKLTSHTAQYADTNHFIVDEDFDWRTGLVRTSRDTAGVATNFRYDTSSRLVLVRPAEELPTTYEYAPAAATPKVVVRQCVVPSNGVACSGSSWTEARYYYDDLGRLFQERHAIPDGWSATWTTFDGIGRTATKSVPITTTSGDAGTAPTVATTAWTYDLRGRVLRETRPDGSRTSFSYSGARETFKSIFDPGPSLGLLRSTERLDGSGRLLAVIQPSGPTNAATPQGANVTTEYTYDHGDRLTSVTMYGAEAGTPSQSRSFTYDGAGFLLEESHPENGATEYTGFDARGHAQKRTPSGGHSIFKHKYTYDPAERLVQVETGNPSGTPGTASEFRVEKTFVFGTANDERKGRLHKAIRQNFRPCSGSTCYGDDIRVTEEYSYDSSGRKSGRTTIVENTSDAPAQLIKSITQNFTYTALGKPSTLSYPTCSGCGDPPVANSQRNIPLIYSKGVLHSVGSYVTELNYSASGALESVEHANDMIDTITLDSSDRPKSIAFGSWSSCGTPPSISAGGQPDDVTIDSGTSTTLTVAASGTNLTYQWYIAGSNPVAIQGATSSQYTTPALTSNQSYFVRVANACKTIESETATVTATCSNPSIATPPQSQSLTAGSTVNLTVSTSQTPVTYQWYRGASGDTSQPVGTNSSSYTTPPINATTRYWVRVTRSCGGSTNSAAAVLTVALNAPTNVVASMTSLTSIQVTWSPVANAGKYEVWRKSNGSSFVLANGNASSGWIDAGRTQGTTYLYRVRALDSNNESASPYSDVDLATLMTFTPAATSPSAIDLDHVQQLLAAVNALRAANGNTTPLTWSGILPVNVPEPALTQLVRRAHLEALREQFTSALEALNLDSPGYTNPNLTTAPSIRAIHITELQQRAQ